ncbi:MAG TPA: SDR family NAD(P)-dependent oxidoreductase [Micromonosporaceae bacterium]|jgi:NAD(P)-dependent dehydrogenase (short-subunit alcohol dehydrogenase family)
MSGKVVVVTGATGGIGKEVARGLVGLGAHVVIGARDPQRGEATRQELGAAGSGGVAVLPLDVADQSSVRAFAAAFIDQHRQLDVLVNNAGAWFSDRRESPDGYELTFATNVLGPHLLTELLLDALLRAAPGARVVNIVSAIVGNYDATDLQYQRRAYDGYKAYAQSKQALSMLTWGLAARLTGQGVTANTAAPGFVRTGFNRNAHGPRAAMIGLMSRLFAVSPEKGADTPLWAASAAELDGVTGQAFTARKARPPKFTEPGPIAELERFCGGLERATG